MSPPLGLQNPALAELRSRTRGRPGVGLLFFRAATEVVNRQSAGHLYPTSSVEMFEDVGQPAHAGKLLRGVIGSANGGPARPNTAELACRL